MMFTFNMNKVSAFTMRDGEAYTGIVSDYDEESVMIVKADGSQLVLDIKDIRKVRVVKKQPMFPVVA